MTNIFYTPTLVSDGTGGSSSVPTYALVIDVITNEEHKDYSESGFNVGTIRFKNIYQGDTTDLKNLSFVAFPKDVFIQEYPLIGEIVIVEKIFNSFYYSKRVNITHRVNDVNTIPYLLESLQIQLKTDKSQDRKQASMGIMKRSKSSKPPLKNDDFVVQENNNPLKHFLGDQIIQGRFGASIRLSSAMSEDALNGIVQLKDKKKLLGPTIKKNSPLMILRVGQYKDSKLTVDTVNGLTMEDINNDDSIIVLTSNQNLLFKLSIFDKPNTGTSSTTLSNLNSGQDNKISITGRSILFNSGKIVLNSKDDRIILSSQTEINLLTGKDFTVDSNQNITMTTNITSLNSNKIYLGEQNNESEPVVLGKQLVDWLSELCLELTREIHPTPMGPSGVPINAAKYNALKAKLDKILSKRNFGV